MTTYATLQGDIGSWLSRDDLTAYIPSFIRLAEARINREVRHWKMLKRSTASGNGTRFLALPREYIEMKRLKLVTSPESPPITMRAPDQLDVAGAAGSTAARNATAHEELEFDVAVAATVTVEMVFYGRLDALSVSNTTNWYLTYAYDLYLMAALAESAPFLKEDERIATWVGRYEVARDGLNEVERRHHGGSTRRVLFPTTSDSTP